MKNLSQLLVKPGPTPSEQKQEYEEILKNALKRKNLRKTETLHERYVLVRYEVL